jgi:hypothetical protein
VHRRQLIVRTDGHERGQRLARQGGLTRTQPGTHGCQQRKTLEIHAKPHFFAIQAM